MPPENRCPRNVRDTQRGQGQEVVEEGQARWLHPPLISSSHHGYPQGRRLPGRFILRRLRLSGTQAPTRWGPLRGKGTCFPRTGTGSPEELQPRFHPDGDLCLNDAPRPFVFLCRDTGVGRGGHALSSGTLVTVLRRLSAQDTYSRKPIHNILVLIIKVVHTHYRKCLRHRKVERSNKTL